MSYKSQAAIDKQSGRFGSGYAIDDNAAFSSANLRNKSVVITGGASGIGEAVLRRLVQAGAFVTFLDLSSHGTAIESELGRDAVAFVRGSVSQWSDQKNLFRTAIERAPAKRIDVVFANAGTGYPSTEIANDADENGEPVEPDLNVLSTNLNGALYSMKLAVHYFRRQAKETNRNPPGCLVFTSSVAGYAHATGPMYTASKWGVRGLMRSLRTALPETVMRVNVLAPWVIRTQIVASKYWNKLENEGALFCEIEDAASAVLHLAADKGIHGRCFTVVPRSIVARGYTDLDRDGYDVEGLIATWYKPKI